jgi:putative glutamine amidotransferase
MKKLMFVMIFACIAMITHSAEKFYEKVSKNRNYIILANPTVSNIETIRFMLKNHILIINQKNTEFAGIYHKGQAYDFNQSMKHIEDQKIKGFQLLEIEGELPESDIFRENSCTEEFRKIFQHSIGIFFFGGPDIQPEIYGEANTHSVVTDPARHTMEVSLLFHLLGSSRNPGFSPFLNENPDYMVTGFCLGLQTMNVATGGTLVQDIPYQIYGRNTPQETVTVDQSDLHRNYWQEFNTDKQLMGINLHPFSFNENPFFGKKIRLAKRFHPMVYSSHHQSVENIGQGFEVTALSSDGKVIEGLAHKKYPNVFAVQFHPEVPALYEDREEWKFRPDDIPKTYHQIIGKESVDFHKKYWKHISKGLKESERNKRLKK